MPLRRCGLTSPTTADMAAALLPSVVMGGEDPLSLLRKDLHTLAAKLLLVSLSFATNQTQFKYAALELLRLEK